MAQLVRDMLSHTGVDVETFSLGADLLKSPPLLHFKAVLLDLSLPDIDGFDLMDRFAALAFNAPIVLMSGHEAVVLRAAKTYGHGVGLPIVGALAKPFSQEALLAALGLAL